MVVVVVVNVVGGTLQGSASLDVCGVLASVSSQIRFCLTQRFDLTSFRRRIYSASGHGPAREFGFSW